MLRELLKKRFGSKHKEHYKSIFDFPIYNWIKMRKHNDYSFLIKDKTFHGSEISHGFAQELNDSYLGMLTEFFEEFGQTKDFKDEIKLKSKIIDLNLNFIQSGDKFILNEIDILKKRLLEKQSKNIDKDLNVSEDMQEKQMISRVASSLPYSIDIRTLSVFKFYTQLTFQDTKI